MIHPRQIQLTLDPLKDLANQARPNNPKAHDNEAIVASIVRSGFITVVVVNDRDKKLLAGHGRIEALLAMRARGIAAPAGVEVAPDGEWLVPTIHGPDLDEADAMAFVVADNRTTELGGWDEKRLAQVLLELSETSSGLTGVGFGDDDLDRLVSEILADADRQAPHPDELPETDEQDVIVKQGDVWLAGRHIVACNDARTPELLGSLLRGQSAACLLTDPPYGVSYKGKSGARLSIANDTPEGLDELLAAAFANVDTILAPGGAAYVFHPAGPLSLRFGQAVIDAGWSFRQSLVWNKGVGVLGRSDYHYGHEPIIYASKPAGRGKGRPCWYGGRDQTSVLEFPRPRQSSEHPTMKPVALIEALLKNSTQRGDIAIDPFLGSGSTLVAAERLGRRCVGVELEPRYAQVAIRRWERLTGQTAHLQERNA